MFRLLASYNFLEKLVAQLKCSKVFNLRDKRWKLWLDIMIMCSVREAVFGSFDYLLPRCAGCQHNLAYTG